MSATVSGNGIIEDLLEQYSYEPSEINLYQVIDSILVRLNQDAGFYADRKNRTVFTGKKYLPDAGGEKAEELPLSRIIEDAFRKPELGDLVVNPGTHDFRLTEDLITMIMASRLTDSEKNHLFLRKGVPEETGCGGVAGWDAAVFEDTCDSSEIAMRCSRGFRRILDTAKKRGIHSLAMISVPKLGDRFPVGYAADVLIATARDWIAQNHDFGMAVEFCCDEAEYGEFRKRLFPSAADSETEVTKETEAVPAAEPEDAAPAEEIPEAAGESEEAVQTREIPEATGEPAEDGRTEEIPGVVGEPAEDGQTEEIPEVVGEPAEDGRTEEIPEAAGESEEAVQTEENPEATGESEEAVQTDDISEAVGESEETILTEENPEAAGEAEEAGRTEENPETVEEAEEAGRTEENPETVEEAEETDLTEENPETDGEAAVEDRSEDNPEAVREPEEPLRLKENPEAAEEPEAEDQTEVSTENDSGPDEDRRQEVVASLARVLRTQGMPRADQEADTQAEEIPEDLPEPEADFEYPIPPSVIAYYAGDPVYGGFTSDALYGFRLFECFYDSVDDYVIQTRERIFKGRIPSETLWTKIRHQVRYRGMLEKFRQNPELLELLLSTDLAVLEREPSPEMGGRATPGERSRMAEESQLLMRARRELRIWYFSGKEGASFREYSIDDPRMFWEMKLSEIARLPGCREIVMPFASVMAYYQPQKIHDAEEFIERAPTIRVMEAAMNRRKGNAVPEWREMLQRLSDAELFGTV